MSNYKYPYIPREYYAAVMGVVGDFGNSQDEERFNQLVNLHSARFWVNRQEVARYARIRLAVERNTPSWFIVAERIATNAGDLRYQYPQVMKGWSAETVTEPFSYRDWKQGMDSDFYNDYLIVYSHEAIAEFGTEEEAKEALPSWKALVEKYEQDEDRRRGDHR